MTIAYQQLSNGDLFSSPSLLHCARRCLNFSTINSTCNAFAFDNLIYGWVGLQKTYFHLNILALFIILISIGAKITTHISLIILTRCTLMSLSSLWERDSSDVSWPELTMAATSLVIFNGFSKVPLS